MRIHSSNISLCWIHTTPSFSSAGRSQQPVKGPCWRTQLPLGETKQPPKNTMEIPADVSPPACYTLPQGSCCTNFQSHLLPKGKTTDTAGAGLSSCTFQKAATKWWFPLGAEAGCHARKHLCSRCKGKKRLQRVSLSFPLGSGALKLNASVTS